jgi:hypothetical protein
MPAGERGGLKAAFTNFNRPDPEKEAEKKLLGREVVEVPPAASPVQPASSYPVATGGLVPRPLLQREAVRQLSFRCPVSTATELRRKSAFNQLEQQEIIIEGIRRVLLELPDPPEGWEP